MVLQRDLPVRIWGKADPGEKVTVSIGKDEATTQADKDGRWKVELSPLKAGNPVEVHVSGKNTITLRDVLVGEVWVCSGQSNMQMSMNGVTNAKQEIAAANHPHIRLFTVPMRPAGQPADDVDGYWKPCTPDNVAAFSAVAYFFGRTLHKSLGVPIGLINTSWGGTYIEPWTPPVGFRGVPSLASIVTKIEDGNAKYQRHAAAHLDHYEAQIAQWLEVAKKAKAAGEAIPSPPAWPDHPLNKHTEPTGLYNGMIHPLVPLAIRGAIWYQGESNRTDGVKYGDKMKALIEGWRSVWNEGEFPFLFVQIAPYNYGPTTNPTDLARLWEGQTSILTSEPNTGMAVINDIGEIKDIHPHNKLDVGKRLALWALVKTYGKRGMVYSGPLYKASQVDGSSIRVTFAHVGSGLISRDRKPLSWFAIAGADKKFVPRDRADRRGRGGRLFTQGRGTDGCSLCLGPGRRAEPRE